jgi:hypothetical protein
MMPADLIYVMSSQRQRAAMNAARSRRIAAHDTAKALALARKQSARTQGRTVGLRVRIRARVLGSIGWAP